MTPTKPTNAVVALADLLATTVQEYEQKLGEQREALQAVGRDLKRVTESAAILESYIFAAVRLIRDRERSMFQDSNPSIQIGSRDLVSRWLKEIVECLTPPPPEPSGAPSRPPT